MPTALITGGSQGLGRALARSLVADGWTVIVDGRRADLLAAAAAALSIPPRDAIAGDVRDPAHRDALVDAVARTGRLDLLVNNASTLGPTPLHRLADIPVDGLREIFEVNVVAPLALAQQLLPFVRATGGAIVNVTSDAAVEGYEGWGGYGSSKAALDQASNVLAAEEPGIRVWAFDPGDMRTEMHQAAFPGEDIADRPEPESVVPALRRVIDLRPPSGRIRAADVGDLAVAP